MSMTDVKPEIKDLKTLIHISGKVHQTKSSGTIVWPGNPIDGKIIFKESFVTKNKASGAFGKSKSYYYLEGDGVPDFDSIEKLIAHYTINKQP